MGRKSQRSGRVAPPRLHRLPTHASPREGTCPRSWAQADRVFRDGFGSCGVRFDTRTPPPVNCRVPLLILLLDFYSLIVFVSVVLSWLRLSPDNPVVRVVALLTEPLLKPIRKVLPDIGGFDLSPMVLLIAIRLLKFVLVR